MKTMPMTAEETGLDSMAGEESESGVCSPE